MPEKQENPPTLAHRLPPVQLKPTPKDPSRLNLISLLLTVFCVLFCGEKLVCPDRQFGKKKRNFMRNDMSDMYLHLFAQTAHGQPSPQLHVPIGQFVEEHDDAELGSLGDPYY